MLKRESSFLQHKRSVLNIRWTVDLCKFEII